MRTGTNIEDERNAPAAGVKSSGGDHPHSTSGSPSLAVGDRRGLSCLNRDRVKKGSHRYAPSRGWESPVQPVQCGVATMANMAHAAIESLYLSESKGLPRVCP
jgi:hypothetical protein